MSAEFIQKHEAADEHGEWNPEMDVGGDHAEKISGSGEVGRVRQYFNLQNAVLESGVPS
jgi:hypothetical protein